MAFGQGFQRDDRRRRVVTDAVLNAAADAKPRARRRKSGAHASRFKGKSENYGNAEFLDEQPRLTDLIPTRLSTLSLILVGGGGVIATLEELYFWMPRLAAGISSERISPLDLSGPGTLAAWLSTLTLALAGLVAVTVYSIRRHRRDDYHGHYRIWLWASLGCFLMSLDAATGLHETCKTVLTALSGTRLLGDGAVWWIAPYGFLFGAIGSRLVVEMRHCRLSTATILLAAACYLAAMASRLGWIALEGERQAIMARCGAILSGHLLVLVALGLHARHVLLDAQGLLGYKEDTEKPAEPAGKKGDEDLSEADASSTEETVLIHPPHGLPRPKGALAGKSPATQPDSAHPVAASVAKPAPAVASPASPTPKPAPPPAAASIAPDTPPVNRKLTKQEKRALRERLDRMRKQREQEEEE